MLVESSQHHYVYPTAPVLLGHHHHPRDEDVEEVVSDVNDTNEDQGETKSPRGNFTVSTAPSITTVPSKSHTDTITCCSCCLYTMICLILLLLLLGTGLFFPTVWKFTIGASVSGFSLDSRKLQCTYQMARLAMRTSGFTKNMETLYAANATTELLQTGRYYGAADVYEYMNYGNATANPLFSSIENRATSLHIQGYPPDDDKDTCEFLLFTAIGAGLAPEFGGNPGVIAVGTNFMRITTTHTTYPEILRTQAYLPPAVVEYSLSTVTHEPTSGTTPPMYDFICTEVLAQACRQQDDNFTAPDYSSCVDRLHQLPVTEGPLAAIDGNSLGCRVVHAIFARTNPEQHCAHVALDPTPDAKGNIKCQQTEGRSVDELAFSEADWAFYEREMVKLGIDPAVGVLMEDLS